jgi:lipid-A-disaccharide synthase-like uncharacterized protein
MTIPALLILPALDYEQLWEMCGFSGRQGMAIRVLFECLRILTANAHQVPWEFTTWMRIT